MTFAHTIQMTAVNEIAVDRGKRQRRNVSTKGLLESIKARGIMHPLIITREKQLVVGERRLTCAKELGHEFVPTRFVDDLDETELQLIELDENIKRMDLPWQDVVQAMVSIHGLYLSRDRDWTMGETANECGVSVSLVSMYLKVGGFLHEERIAEASTVREAYNMLGRRDQRASAEALNELLEITNELDEIPSSEPGPETPTTSMAQPAELPKLPLSELAPPRPRLLPENQVILEESFLFWAPKYSGKKFNFIHCDFPYGINVFAGPQGGGAGREYADDEAVYKRLVDCLLDNLDKLMGQSAHLMFWFSEVHREWTMEQFRQRAPSLTFVRHPLIWFKSDNTGISPDSRRTPRHVYETAFLAYRGSRNLIQVKADAYAAPVQRALHPSAKPEPMLKHFFEMLVDQYTEMLDPSCGSASAIRAAEALGAKRCLGMDTDNNVVGLARTDLKRSRIMRGQQ